jgi:hypothetical protein
VIPTGFPPPREPTALERLAELAGVDPDAIRALLRAEIEEAERELIRAVLAEAIAESAIASAADNPKTTPGPQQQRIQRRIRQGQPRG